MITDEDTKQGDARGQLPEMPFLSHLEELRKVIIQSLIAIGLLTVACWFTSKYILNLMIQDLPLDSLYFLSPLEAFMVRMKISLIVGLMLAFPFVLFKVWSFVSPGLFAHERSKLVPVVVASSLLFYAGVLFCYLMLIPVVMGVLLSFGTEYLNPLISVQSYFAFVSRLSFTFGVVFQLPVLVLLLSSLGLVTPRMLLRQWRYGVLIIFVGSAILTPPDVISLVFMALPILLLYIGSILVAMVVVRRKDKEDDG